MALPWKNCTLVKCRLNKPSSSSSGGTLNEKSRMKQKVDGSRPVKKDDLHIDIVSIFMKKVLEEVADRVVGYVTADDDVSGKSSHKR